MNPLKIKISPSLRQATNKDLNFICNSWLKSYRTSVKEIPAPIFFMEHRRVIQSILDNAVTVVACDPTDDDQIFGYLVYQEKAGAQVIQYAYTKSIFRRMGVLSSILDEVAIDKPFYTHHTWATEIIAPKINATLNPYWMFK